MDTGIPTISIVLFNSAAVIFPSVSSSNVKNTLLNVSCGLLKFKSCNISVKNSQKSNVPFPSESYRRRFFFICLIVLNDPTCRNRSCMSSADIRPSLSMSKSSNMVLYSSTCFRVRYGLIIRIRISHINTKLREKLRTILSPTLRRSCALGSEVSSP